MRNFETFVMVTKKKSSKVIVSKGAGFRYESVTDLPFTFCGLERKRHGDTYQGPRKINKMRLRRGEGVIDDLCCFSGTWIVGQREQELVDCDTAGENYASEGGLIGQWFPNSLHKRVRICLKQRKCFVATVGHCEPANLCSHWWKRICIFIRVVCFVRK